MKKTIVGINLCALALLAMLLLIGYFRNDFEMQGTLTEIDRAECFNQENFTKHYGKRFRSVRDQDFANFLASPWIGQWYAAIIIGALLATSNIALAVRYGKAGRN